MHLKNYTNYLSVIILLFFLFTTHNAQDLTIKRYTTRDGLPTNRIFNGIQDKTGSILLATDAGVVSYDGKKFELLNDSTFTRFMIGSLSFDTKGDLWLLPRRSSNAIQYHKNQKTNLLPAITDQNEQPFLLKTFDFITIDGKEYPIVLSNNSKLFIYKNLEWTEFIELKDIIINNIFVTNNVVYLLTTKGIYTYKDSELVEQKEINALLPSKNVLKIISDPNNPENFFLLSNSWLGQLSQNKFELITKNFNLTTLDNTYQFTILSVIKENIYFGNAFSLYRYNFNTNEISDFIFDKVSQGEGGSSIFTDYESNIWISTFRGLYKIRFTPFTNITAKEGLRYDEVTSIEFMNNNNFALGQEANLAIYNTSSKKIINIPIDSGEHELNVFLRIWDLLFDSKERLWIVEFARGVGFLDGQKINWLDLNLDYKIESICEDSKGQIWLGTDNGLYNLLPNFKLKHEPATEKIDIRKLFVGKSGNLFLATKNRGLWIYENSEFTSIETGDKDIDNIYSLFESSLYGTLVGTKAGLFILRNNTLEKFESNNFSISRAIYLICADLNDNVWFGLNEGLIRWNGRDALEYTTSDGLSGLEINRDAGSLDKKGNLWFGTNGGLSIFNNTYDYNPNVKPKGKVNFVESFKEKYYNLNTLLFDSDENNLVFDVSALSYIDEDYNRFHVKLSSGEKTIDSFVTDESRIRFSYLSPGDYQFNLQFENARGTLSDSVYTSAFSIKNPFYESIWFLILVAISIIVITAIIFQYFTQLKHSKDLEQKVELRTKDLQKEISQKEHFEKALIASEKRYKDLFENSAFGIYQSTIEGKFVLCNSAFLKMFGLKSIEELNKLNIANTFYIESEERTEFIKKMLKEKFVTGIEKKYRTIKNEVIWVRESARCIEVEENKILIEGAVENITANKIAEASIIEAKEKAENSNKIKSEFLAQMSHEIRTPVNTILNFTSLIKDEVGGRDNDEIDEYFESIQLGSDRLIRTIDSILNLSQLQLRTYDLNKEKFDIAEVIRGVIAEFKPLAKNKGLELNFDRNDLEISIFADKYSVSQIFANLIDNAIKYTEKGRVNVSIWKNNDSKVSVKIEDTGLGMSKEFMKKLFEPFTQEESGYTRRFDGNGLGLALVKNYCYINKAEITVESVKGEGTNFTVEFNIV